MRTLTDFGDTALLFPLVLVLLIWLGVMVRGRLAVAWAAAVAACVGVTLALKLYFNACAAVSASLHSPSGHASMSTLVYGALFLVASAELDGWRGRGVAGAGALVILAIAVSRVVLQAHSAAEVVVGTAVGAAALAGFAVAYRRAKPPRVALWPLLVGVAATILLLHGREFTLEDLLRRIALRLRDSLGIC
jgi:membrane-associated phospholipid phosphatase